MPEGPFGFPRVTNIGPFTEVEAEQEFTREEDNTFIVGTDVDREIASIHGVDMDDLQDVKSRLIVRTEIDRDRDTDSIMGRIQSEFDVIRRENNIAKMDYWYDPDNSVAKIFDVKVEKTFRRMGIATQLKEQELDYMTDQGVKVVYTDIISEGGYRLAKATDFRPLHQADHLYGEETILRFNERTNRGIMFKYL